jgi:hypothetical protein
MKTHALALGGCLLAMFVAAPALAQGGDWQRVPPAAEPGAMPNLPAGTAGALGGMLGNWVGKSSLGCELIGRLADEAAKARDKGVSEQSQLKTVDDSNGKLHTLAAASHLPAGATQALGVAIDNEIAYVYAHREMTPAQLQAHFENECAHPAGAGSE